MPNHRPRRAFTLVEMLVVIGIIAVLAALLLPAVFAAIGRARNAAIAIELKQVDTAIEAYRLEKGDYPPNFRDPEVVRRHIAKCYPKINPVYFDVFMKRTFPLNNGVPAPAFPPSQSNPQGTVVFDEAEALVFWLSMTDTNPSYPFLSYMQPPGISTPLQVNAKRYYDFDETRLLVTTQAKPPLTSTTPPLPATADVSSFTARFCKDTFYLYLDSRSYDKCLNEAADLARFPSDGGAANFAYSKTDPNNAVRPYWTFTKNPNALLSPNPLANQYRNQYKPVNATTFQLICAGQDGEFGYDPSDSDVKVFNTGINTVTGQGYNLEDKDNIANFSGGRTLGDSIP